MKNIYCFLIVVFSISSAFAQTTAQDWTRADCAGKSHHLFSELDSGNVVILEYVMMNCGSCVTAGNALKTIKNPYKISHPGKVRVYSIGYTNTYPCSQMQSWKTANNFTHPVFTGGASDVSYYGGMGMPTIVVVANNIHKVYYKQFGYSTNDDVAIQAAINLALAQSNQTGTREELAHDKDFRAFPNPVQNQLNLFLKPGAADKVIVTDLLGKRVLSADLAGLDKMKLNTSKLATGVYMVAFLKNGEILTTRKFIKE